MALSDLLFKALYIGAEKFGTPRFSFDWRIYKLNPAERTRLAAEASDGLPRLFFAHHGRLVNKWVHYLDVYERHFAPYRNTPLKMLEIGVFKGGSLDLWRDYFGADAKIFGIDLDPECANRVTPPNQVRIGSQDNAKFLRSVVDELGAPDIILDDAAHVGRLQRASFDVLFPLLREGGLYVIEDLCTSYWRGVYEGGYRRKGSGIEFIKEMIDDMHAWYHNKATRTPAKEQIGAIHVYDSIVVIEKRKIKPPAYIKLE
jgi:hypothetical protein